MTATDELRRLLDECGVEYLDSEDDTTIYYADSGYRYTYNTNPESGWAQLFGYHLTPEQAVAATLGGPTFDTDLERALSFMRIWISDDAHLGESDISYALERAEGLRNLDAIEQAITATMGAGECELTLDGTDGNFGCSKCLENVPPLANFCPNCGRKVKR